MDKKHLEKVEDTPKFVRAKFALFNINPKPFLIAIEANFFYRHLRAIFQNGKVFTNLIAIRWGGWESGGY